MKKEQEAIKRTQYACQLLDNEQISYEIKKIEIGHINLYYEGKVVMSFWARTGRFIFTIQPTKIKYELDADFDRGIKKLIQTYKKEFMEGK